MKQPSSRIIRNDPKCDRRATRNGNSVAAHRIGLTLDQRRVQCRVRRIVLLGTIDDLKVVTVQVAETRRSATNLWHGWKENVVAQWM